MRISNLAAPALAAVMLFTAGAANAQDSAAIFKRQCASCHGPDGSGKTSMGKVFKLRDLKSPDVQGMTDAQLFDTIAKGKGKMPAFEPNLGKQGIEGLVAYIRSLAKGGGGKKK
jgi:mono/diheme cytochrome c family protein